LYGTLLNFRRSYKEKNFEIIKICIDCFKKIMGKNKKSENNKKILYSVARLNKIIKNAPLTRSVCELLVEYDEFDWNCEIIIYDDMNFYRMNCEVLHYKNDTCYNSNSRYGIGYPYIGCPEEYWA